MDLFAPLAGLIDYLDEDEAHQVRAAYDMAESAHASQKRLTGEPYVTHPVQVASILASMKFDHETLIAGLLHDVLEDTPLSEDLIRDQFGEKAAALVDGVSKLTSIKFQSDDLIEAENFRKMLLAMSQDIRVIIIKLIDRLHNMRTVQAHKPEKRKIIAHETVDIFAPIARRLGMHDVALELEDLGFAQIYPQRYRVLKNAVHRVQGAHFKMLEEIRESIESSLHSLVLTDGFLVTAREKHLYSIYRKMKRKKLSFFEMTDVYGVRISVSTVSECYMALGSVHGVYRPVPNRFRDYIALPKENGYQSLHTVLFGLHGVPIEVQIRTHEMSWRAQTGICAHWRYKSDAPIDNKSVKQGKKWLDNLMAIKLTDEAPEQFISDVKEELFSNDIYVFTPKGKIVELPQGATAIDFAFAVHTDIGLQAILAKVDRELAPLSTELRNGHTVEIITTKDAVPNASYLNFITTPRARNAIKQYLSSQKDATLALEGKRLLDHTLQSLGLQMEELLSLSHDKLLKKTGKKTMNHVYISLARGDLDVQDLLVFFDSQKKKSLLSVRKTGVNRLVHADAFVTYGACCQPLPGDVIVSELHRKDGVVIHRDNCLFVLSSRKRDLFEPVSWGGVEDHLFDSTLKLTLPNRYGMLAKLATLISNLKIDIVDIHIEHRRATYIDARMLLKVKNRPQIQSMVHQLEKEASFINAHRCTPDDLTAFKRKNT